MTDATEPPQHCADLAPERLADYLDFFDHRAFTDNPRWAGCYCYYPLHDPAVIRWHDRSGADNRGAVQAAVAAGQARGVLAYRGDQVVGWCSAGPWSQYPMLRDVPTPPDADRLGVVFCFVVAPDARGQGVATALLDAACASLQRQGLAAVMARPLADAQGDAANHLGPLALYRKAGFSVVGDGGDGHLLVRKALAAPA
jgi:ribosomal protein S18 acetylase RimI-like enzyme